MLTEASDELEAIEGLDRLSAEVMDLRCDLYLAARNWELLLAVSRELIRARPSDGKGWIHTGRALRELHRFPEASAVLAEAVRSHAGCAQLHYQLASCHCLLGEAALARESLRRACQLNPEFKTKALDDPDLRALWDEAAP
jgi:cytochrome c-type biogenesis protein CcmH/NrfG